MKNKIDCVSIYLGRACNLRCKWCYDQANDNDSLDIDAFKDFYDHIIKDNIRDVILIGGEPLVYPDIERIIDICKNQNIHIASNGLGMADNRILSLFLNHEKVSIYLSIKGFDKQSFISITNTDGYDDLIRALNKTSNLEMPVYFSYVFNGYLSDLDIDTFISFCKENKINAITISEPRPFLSNDGKVIKTDCDHTQFQKFVEYLISHAMAVNIKIQSPFCEYSSDFIEKMLAENRIVSSCSIKSGGAFAFNSDLELVLCHSNYDVRIGKYGEDFENYDELISYFFSDGIRKVYNKFKGCPQKRCIGCNHWKKCGGGCILNWRKL